jgi:hypothetical protein
MPDASKIKRKATSDRLRERAVAVISLAAMWKYDGSDFSKRDWNRARGRGVSVGRRNLRVTVLAFATGLAYVFRRRG